MEDLLEEIERAVRTRGWSARQASLRAVGSPELIRDMRRGRVPSVERFRALCETLGLEFYVGRPRSRQSLDPDRLELAIEVADKAIEFTGHTLTRAEKARVVPKIYDLVGEYGADADANAGRIIWLIERMVRTRSTERPERDEERQSLLSRIRPLRRRP